MNFSVRKLFKYEFDVINGTRWNHPMNLSVTFKYEFDVRNGNTNFLLTVRPSFNVTSISNLNFLYYSPCAWVRNLYQNIEVKGKKKSSIIPNFHTMKEMTLVDICTKWLFKIQSAWWFSYMYQLKWAKVWQFLLLTNVNIANTNVLLTVGPLYEES